MKRYFCNFNRTRYYFSSSDLRIVSSSLDTVIGVELLTDQTITITVRVILQKPTSQSFSTMPLQHKSPLLHNRSDRLQTTNHCSDHVSTDYYT